MLNKIFGKKETKFFLELKDTDGGKPATKTETPAPAVEAPAAEAPAAEAPAPAPTAKKGVSKKTSVKKAEPKAAPAPAPAPTASTNGKVEPKEVEFATKYLITPPASRRRPGPSLNQFKDMARTAKVPRR
ncbi:hypothetical protein V0288_01695 [Pannus brasiliensis CCIBt3594]|uniref:Uncharacterized protein n=1 Tax=Pannus brasiliensis CCIBt3594 TaxID=1427578 RepID=A0AAW9QL24_9CHRO